MLLLQLVITLLTSVKAVLADEISGVFTSFDSLTFSHPRLTYTPPNFPTWTAVFGWDLEGSTARPGDVFTLVMPCVFKFLTSTPYVELTADGVTYATCRLNSGEEFVLFSSMECTVSENLTPSSIVYGQVSVPLTFNAGGSGSETDIEASTCFVVGENTVTFTDGDNSLSIQVNFEANPADPSGLLSSQRVIQSLAKSLALVIIPDCPNGYASGTLGISSTADGYQLDCNSIEAGLTSGLNAWNNPIDNIDFPHTSQCTTKGFSISFLNIPAGYRPFINALATVPSTEQYRVAYEVKYTCVGGSYRDDSMTRLWNPYQRSEADLYGQPIEIITRTVTEATTYVTTLPFDSATQRTRTIEIVKQMPLTTITGSYVGVTTRSTTLPFVLGETATVLVE